MNKVTVHYVTFWSPGIMFGENWTQPIETPDPERIAWPDNAYAFTLHSRVDVKADGATFKGEPQQIGPMYYHPSSKVETLAEVKLSRPGETILIRNMEGNGWDALVWSRWGNWPQPFDPAKHVVMKDPS